MVLDWGIAIAAFAAPTSGKDGKDILLSYSLGRVQGTGAIARTSKQRLSK
jgi:hypothetical protein